MIAGGRASKLQRKRANDYIQTNSARPGSSSQLSTSCCVRIMTREQARRALHFCMLVTQVTAKVEHPAGPIAQRSRGGKRSATVDARTRVISPGGVGFETSSARVDGAQCWFQKPITTSQDGVSVLVIGNWLSLPVRKPDDNHVNANGKFLVSGQEQPTTRVSRLCCAVVGSHRTLGPVSVKRGNLGFAGDSGLCPCATFCAAFALGMSWLKRNG
jgi:hypothetical protein